jgi:hypothetical protein
MASAAMVAGGFVSTGGVAALFAKVFRLQTGSWKRFLMFKFKRRNDHGFCNEQEWSA